MVVKSQHDPQVFHAKLPKDKENHFRITHKNLSKFLAGKKGQAKERVKFKSNLTISESLQLLRYTSFAIQLLIIKHI